MRSYKYAHTCIQCIHHVCMSRTVYRADVCAYVWVIYGQAKEGAQRAIIIQSEISCNDEPLMERVVARMGRSIDHFETLE